jgi:hypothetical protein
MYEYLFLLGGHDLEMIEIRNILENKSQKYIDKDLSWGAKLSDYQDSLNANTDKTIVAIELNIDIKKTDNFINIDHHNDNSIKKTSIEQVAELLKIELNEDQRIVAINDVSHIEGMRKEGISEEKILEIRQRDRKAQGVTNEDERLGKESIEDKVYKNGVCVIKAKTSKFSTITDRLNETHLIIYTDTELNYYGIGRDILIDKFSELIKENKVYYGGTSRGFLGLSKEKFIKEEIEIYVEEIVKWINL